MPKNLEFKARVRELNPLEELLASKGAAFVGVLEQRDTYFNIHTGRLKLRETKGKRAELIFYRRDEKSPSKMESNYSILPVQDASLKDFLAETLGVKAVVEKKRRLLMLKNARIHLDEVNGLGSFIEFEVVAGDESGKSGSEKADAELLETLKGYTAPFVVNEINKSYGDLVLMT